METYIFSETIQHYIWFCQVISYGNNGQTPLPPYLAEGESDFLKSASHDCPLETDIGRSGKVCSEKCLDFTGSAVIDLHEPIETFPLEKDEPVADSVLDVLVLHDSVSFHASIISINRYRSSFL